MFQNLTLHAKLMIIEALVSGVAGLIHAGLGLGLTCSFVGLHLRFDRACRCTNPTVQQQMIESAKKPIQMPVCPLLVALSDGDDVTLHSNASSDQTLSQSSVEQTPPDTVDITPDQE